MNNKKISFAPIYFFVILFCSGCFSNNRAGKEYLLARTSAYAPICTFREVHAKSSDVLVTYRYFTGKRFIIGKVYRSEIEQAKNQYHGLTKLGNSHMIAFAASEEPAKEEARITAATFNTTYWDNLPYSCRKDPPPPPLPVELMGFEKAWKLGWIRGWDYNHRRYYEWFNKIEEQLVLSSGLELESQEAQQKDILAAQPCISAPLYDSDWLLYDPGETKILEHNLGLEPEQCLIHLTCLLKNGEIQTASENLEGQWRAMWKDMTGSTIRVQRYFYDDSIDALRLQIWAYE